VPPHGGPPPHEQFPDIEQPSPRMPRVQSTHVLPPDPHEVVVAGSTHVVPPTQQPSHELVLQRQVPPTQTWPIAHGGPLPQEQLPPSQPSARRSHAVHVRPDPHARRVGGEVHVAPEQQPVAHVVGLHDAHTPIVHATPAPQLAHVTPPVPQAVGIVPVRQVFPSQHPPHEVESHRHEPPTQCWPVPHTAPPPQLHSPVGEQLSALPSAVQSKQVSPPMPHVAPLRGRHALPSQHPVAHDAASHPHDPPSQVWPEAHGGPPPQVHVPSGAQPSDRASQGRHASAPVPHAVAVGGSTHVDPEQQPPAHVPALQLEHTPDAHAPPPGQTVQSLPPTPHAAGSVPGRHIAPLQQPAHDAGSQVHAPMSQRWPGPHGGPPPHWHEPAVLQPSVRTGSHAMHAMPGAPHALCEIAVVHEVPEQQPPHDVGSHTHMPISQRWPALHAAPPPHAHCPDVEQRSERTGSQGRHALPPLPHVPWVAVRHVVPSQQPMLHDVASHTHEPPMQRWPGAHSAPPPQVHAPPEHASEREGSHDVQAMPVGPQESMSGGLQVRPEQHPVVHVAAQLEQTPAVQVPAPQLSQAPPPAPHAVGTVPSSQVVPLQQPAHDRPSHTHVPPAHRWPIAHSAPGPQRHIPEEHESARLGSHAVQVPPGEPQLAKEIVAQASPAQQPLAHAVASQVHPPAEHRCPGAHAGAIPHWQAPDEEHAFASIGSQATQLEPPIPHWSRERGWQVKPSQQPAGHEIASQMQSPTTQRWPATHAGPSPHAQSPSTPHPSPRIGSHARHAMPGAPHASRDVGTQVGPVQHPSGQLVALHVAQTPPAQGSPGSHDAHARPPLPHAEG
jgi:hypothetical protein